MTMFQARQTEDGLSHAKECEIQLLEHKQALDNARRDQKVKQTF